MAYPMDWLINVPMTEPQAVTLEKLKKQSEPQAPDKGLGPLPEGRNEVPQIPVNKPALKGSTWADMAKIVGPITWDWPLWLAPGFLHLVTASTGLGKSILALRIAGCYLLGWDWPDGSPFTNKRGDVLWAEAEGAQALNLDRATHWGLPLERIRSPLEDPLQDVSLTNARHRSALAEFARSPEVRLIVLDSLSGSRAGQDENDSRGLEALKFLAALARDTQKPVLVTHHLRKRGLLDPVDGEVTLDRVRGFSGITQLARVVWALDKPARSEGPLRLRVIKSNIGRFPAPLGMEIDEAANVHFTEAPDAANRPSALEEAATFLQDLLANGPVKAEVVLAEAEKAGIAKRTLQRAKVALGVDSYREGPTWFWFMEDSSA